MVGAASAGGASICFETSMTRTAAFAALAVLALAFPAGAAVVQDAAAEAPPPPINLEPGAPVKGSDGAVLGHLQDVQVNAAGAQELLVRGADRLLRAVPLTGIRQDGPGVAVDWKMSDFMAATPIAETRPQPAPAGAPTPN